MDYFCKCLGWECSYKRKEWRKGIYQWLSSAPKVIQHYFKVTPSGRITVVSKVLKLEFCLEKPMITSVEKIYSQSGSGGCCPSTTLSGTQWYMNVLFICANIGLYTCLCVRGVKLRFNLLQVCRQWECLGWDRVVESKMSVQILHK